MFTGQRTMVATAPTRTHPRSIVSMRMVPIDPLTAFRPTLNSKRAYDMARLRHEAAKLKRRSP
jgi:hypothetical protein